VHSILQHRAAGLGNEVQAIDDAGVGEADSGGAADELSGAVGETALWRAAHKNNRGAKTYI
jgi:hypothetical protein